MTFSPECCREPRLATVQPLEVRLDTGSRSATPCPRAGSKANDSAGKASTELALLKRSGAILCAAALLQLQGQRGSSEGKRATYSANHCDSPPMRCCKCCRKGLDHPQWPTVVQIETSLVVVAG